MSLKAEERTEVPWGFPRSSYMLRSGSLRWLCSASAIYCHKHDRNLILCSLSTKCATMTIFNCFCIYRMLREWE